MKVLLVTLLSMPSLLFAKEVSHSDLVSLLFMGTALGLIFMVAIYNALFYFHHKDKSFLYYALMQLGMITVLLYGTDIISLILPSQTAGYLIFTYASLFTLFFIVMFSRSFLQISKHLPQHEKILTIILAFIVIDALFYPMTVIFEMRLYLPIFVYLVYLGFVRVKQHFKPAKFFLFAWIGLAAGVFLDEFSSLDFQPMFIGSVVEAIILAIALSFKVKELKKEKDSQKELLIHQSKLASMGEMLGNISHQWRQPLTRLSYIFMNIENLQIKEHKDFTQEGIAQLELMSQTIDDFTNFYAPSKEKEDFNLAQETRYILELINYEEIDISLEIKEECVLYNYKNEFKQVLLNLLSNAKDILSSREIQSPKIVIIIDKNSIRISDNAGGIWLEDIGKVFEPYFSTKEEGLGIGLYMSKIIIEKNMDGKLQVKNIQDGVEFKVVF